MNRSLQTVFPYILTFLVLWLVLLAVYVNHSLNEKRGDIEQTANTIYLDLREKIKANEIILSGFESLFNSADDPQYLIAKKYASEIINRYPHIYMLEIQEAVSREQRKSFESTMSKRLGFDYKIKSYSYQESRQWTEVDNNELFYPITFIYPEYPEAKSVYGLDIYSVPFLKKAADKAITSNSTYSSIPFELAEGGSGYVMFKPVISLDDSQENAKPDRLVSLLIRPERLINKHLYDLVGLNIELISEDYRYELPLFTASDEPFMRLRRFDNHWFLGDKNQQFILHISSSIGWEAIHPVTVIIITVLLLLSVFMVYKYRIESKTSGDIQARFGRIVDNAINEIYVFDVENLKFMMVNQGAQNNLGYGIKELVNMTPYDIKPDYDEGQFREVIRPLLNGEQESLQFNTIHQRKDGTTYPVEVNLQLYHDETPKVFVAIILDISDRIKDQEKLTYLAKYDELTDLPNRNLFRDRLLHAMKMAKRNNRLVGLMFIDVDNFKTINDTLGHDAGDELLKSIADRIQGVLRDTDTVSRIGGDEFTIIVENCEYAGQLVDVANKIHHSFSESFELNGKTIFSNVSIGIAIYPNDANRDDELLKAADAAMYQAKDNGRSRYHFYTRDMNQIAMEKLELENDLRLAEKNEDFELYYQPQINLSNSNIIAYEALIRWAHPDMGFIPPDKFIPIAEDSGLILDLGEWVIRTALYQALMWNALDTHNHHISVNVSGRQFLDKAFFNKINQLLSMVDGIENCLELEITESVLLQNLDENIRILKSLKDKGMKIAVDDFGTGYSSLNYLKKLPIDTLKIDRSFVSGVCENKQDEAIATTIITLGKSLDLKVIAEGVENEEQLNFLAERGCDAAQGFYIGRPMPANEAENWHARWLKTL
jgi:diguanylate cyclase (GGDEF)-like protein/PAS domain S-box-containing protein